MSRPRSTQSLACERAFWARCRIYSRPSSAFERRASRVSFPDRGAYKTPATAPTPKPAKNQRKLLLLLSDISFLLLNLRCPNVSTRPHETQFRDGGLALMDRSLDAPEAHFRMYRFSARQPL